MKHTITIRKTMTGYTAQFSDPVIVKLFGCDTLHTGYTPKAIPATVLSELSHRNPQYDVVLAKQQLIMKSTLNNQLAQVCNNLYCIIRALKVSWCNDTNNELDNIYLELLAKYNTLFKLIYGNE